MRAAISEPAAHCGAHKLLRHAKYIAHRKKKDCPLTGFFNWAMDRHDREKNKIVSRFVRLDEWSDVLDVGCAVGTFLQKMRARYGARATGVDFKDLSASPTLAGVDFRCGLFYEQDFGDKRFDLVTMWHFLEHARSDAHAVDRARFAEARRAPGHQVPRLDSTTFRLYGDRWPGLRRRTTMLRPHDVPARDGQVGARCVEYLPYGAFPAFSISSPARVQMLRGRGSASPRDLSVFLGQTSSRPARVEKSSTACRRSPRRAEQLRHAFGCQRVVFSRWARW